MRIRMEKIIKTERLILRRFRDKDYDVGKISMKNETVTFEKLGKEET